MMSVVRDEWQDCCKLIEGQQQLIKYPLVKKVVCRRASEHTQWTTATEDHIRWNYCQLRTGS